jgi:hypothetical protein
MNKLMLAIRQNDVQAESMFADSSEMKDTYMPFEQEF